MAAHASTCPACGRTISASDRFCAACGASLEVAADAPTVDSPHGGSGGRADAPPRATTPPRAPSPGSGASQAAWLHSSSGTGTGRFTPGAVVGDRYRIVGLLGRGGMGEVYRADDLTLDQPVALKFLPESLAADPDRRARFLGEVRTARQVTHPNVCRVHDIGEIGGLLYLSMELVDGEDLASLLRRIGRLPGDKAIEIARQLCAGVAAAHARGVLHRDLKPANVMLDSEGKVRLTDFGLAGALEDLRDGDTRAGTPAYMAPEQLTGREVSERSDIYAIGLVLYELFTGRRAFQADTLGELTAMHTSRTPETPSSIRSEMDPTVEAVILRCLEKDPAHRPASALAVAAALPGGDPLAAALAAGETPSPELVAAAGTTSALRPWVSWTILAVMLASLVAHGLLVDGARLFSHVSPERSPDVLAARARDILAGVGHPDRPTDTAQGITTDGQMFGQILGSGDTSPDYWRPILDAHPQPLIYWYRESPRNLVPLDTDGVVSYGDPPLQLSGMARVVLDMKARLVELAVVPPQVIDSLARAAGVGGAGDDPDATSRARADWTALFEHAGLDPERFTEIPPAWTPRTYADEIRSWRGTYAEAPGDTVRIDAAAYAGRPVHFDVVGWWQRPTRQVESEQPGSIAAAQLVSLGIVVSVIIVGVLLARRNLKAGRGDPTGAFRLAGFVGLCGIVAWALSADLSSSFPELVSMFFLAVGNVLFLSAFIWLIYVAIEPYVRKRWPHRIVTWSRVLAGQLRDPMVGRDVLIGVTAGTLVALSDVLYVIVPPELGIAGALPAGTILRSLLGVDQALAVLLGAATQAIVNGLVFLFVPLILLLVVRKEAIAVGIFGLLMVLGLWITKSPVLPLAIAMGVIQAGLFIGLMLRTGLLAVTISFFVYFATIFVPASLNLSTWYAGSSIVTLVIVAGLGVYGFVTASAGRALTRLERLEGPLREPAG